MILWPCITNTQVCSCGTSHMHVNKYLNVCKYVCLQLETCHDAFTDKVTIIRLVLQGELSELWLNVPFICASHGSHVPHMRHVSCVRYVPCVRLASCVRYEPCVCHVLCLHPILSVDFYVATAHNTVQGCLSDAFN